MKKIQKLECCLDFFIDFTLTSTGVEVYEVRWNSLAWVFLVLVLFFPRRCFISFFIILVVEPQTPQWNILITRLRHLFFTYEIAKKSLAKTTWLAIGLFYFLHFSH